jgi:hypothetical protein
VAADAESLGFELANQGAPPSPDALEVETAAFLPGVVLAGIGPDFSGGLGDGYQVALLIGAATTALGALAAVLLVRDATVVVPTRLPSVYQPCGEPCLEETREAS